MHRSPRATSIMIVLMMALPTLLVLSPAVSAQTSVPAAPSIKLEPVVGFTQRLYLTFADVAQSTTGPTAQQPEPQCSNNDPTGTGTTPGSTDDVHVLSFVPKPNQVATQGSNGASRAPCVFTTDATNVVGTTGAVDQSDQKWLSAPITHSFNLSGNASLFYHHKGGMSTGATLTVNVLAGNTPVSSGSYTASGNEQEFNVPLTFKNKQTSFEIPAGQRLTIDLKATGGNANPGGLAGVPQAPTWSIYDNNTYLEVSSVDAMRAATWTADDHDAPRDIFAPLPAGMADPAPRLHAFFSLQSAFGALDARSGGDPIFRFYHNGQLVLTGADQVPFVGGSFNQTVSTDAAGVATWGMPFNALDYRGLPTGDYSVVVEKNYLQGNTIRAGVTHSFSLSSQGVRLTPYSDAVTTPETTAHVVVPGASTTYVMLINNTGAVNDTYSLVSTANTGAAGWSAVIGGPSVHDRSIDLLPNESKLVTLTVTPPNGAAQGANAIFQVLATSRIDPTIKSEPFVTITTVSNTAVRDVNVLFLARDTSIEAGVDTDFPVYVWNRGTSPANLSLEIHETAVSGWSANIYQNGISTSRVVLSNVQPGGIAETTLRMRGPLGSGGSNHPITLNVTDADTAGVALDRDIVFSLRGTAAVTVKILQAASGLTTHVVETQGNPQQAAGSATSTATNTASGGPCTAPPVNNNPATGQTQKPDYCFDDATAGSWFRVWVTNTGKVQDTFDLSIGRVTWAIGPGCNDVVGTQSLANNEGVFSGPDGKHVTVDNKNFGFFTRDSDGKPQSLAVVGNAISNLPPDTTAEIYVWRSINAGNDPSNCHDKDRGDDFVNFVVSAKGRATGAVGEAAADAVAVQTPNTATSNYNDGVLIEAVNRTFSPTSGIGAPTVDIRHANDRLVSGAVAVGQSIIYHVRVTNAASWKAHADPSNTMVYPDVNISLSGIDFAAGWNASIRPIKTDNTNNAFTGNATLTNERPVSGGSRSEAWYDQEYEVKVDAPSAQNRTVFGRDSMTFQILARQGRASDTLSIKTAVANFANINLVTPKPQAFAHAGQPSALLVYLNNSGASRTNVTLRASIDPTTQNALAWRVDPSAQAFDMGPYENRSISFTVTPPLGASPGALGQVNFLVDYAPNPEDLATRTNQTLSLPVEVAGRATLQLSAAQQEVTIRPGGTTTFALNVKNTGNLPLPFQLESTPIFNWSESLSACSQADLSPGENRCVTFVVSAPVDVTNGSRYAAVVQVAEKDNAQNFDAIPLAVSIIGGSAIPSISAPVLQKRLDRGSGAQYEITVKNVGSAAGVILLESRMDNPAWKSYVQDPAGVNVSSVSLKPGELQTFNVTVLAPFVVPERVILPIDVTASTVDFSSASHVTLRAEIHDYGVQLSLTPSRFDAAVPGLANEFVLKAKNTGNDNDTLNFSAIKLDNPDWVVQLSTDKIRLEANQEADVRAVVRSPTSPLPTPRSYEFRFYGASTGAAGVNLSKNDTAVASVSIVNYRALDVDGDGFLELAVDADRSTRNGYEQFKEIVSDGVQSNVVATAYLNGKASFFLDVPRDHGLDGIADVWFDPEAVYAFPITMSPDLNKDGTPDYLVDTDRDGHIESAYDTVTERFLPVTEIHVTGDTSVTQYLVDFNNDGRPDYYYDPVTKLVTKTLGVDGSPNLVGIDTKNDGHSTKYYNMDTKGVEDAKLSNVTNFFAKFWYFFVAFAVLVIVTVVFLVRRRRS